ncbi:hypothetical protein [Solitalea koreensis]|uniref:Uncharacterized protein n=1 Tax=Solitalea koreensis TaxID=543615 RepID=A0A521BRK2_9SPHI|nr:hypothetical protein [Solitalea koreensis]SMO49802.1 hypothetical protein SAMN06265350_102492 [Solitalea koreensis]
MTNDFSKIMQKRTDEELLKIVTDLRFDYQLEAVQAAENEIEVRNIQLPNIDLEEIRLTNHVDSILKKSNERLEPHWRAVVFIFPAILIYLLFAFSLSKEGYKRKSKEILLWSAYGIGSYITLGVLMEIISTFFNV